jgi:hypothetical protein
VRRRRADDELEPRHLFQHLQTPPGVAIRHVQLGGRLAQRPSLVDQLEKAGRPSPSFNRFPNTTHARSLDFATTL